MAHTETEKHRNFRSSPSPPATAASTADSTAPSYAARSGATLSASRHNTSAHARSTMRSLRLPSGTAMAISKVVHAAKSTSWAASSAGTSVASGRAAATAVAVARAARCKPLRTLASTFCCATTVCAAQRSLNRLSSGPSRPTRPALAAATNGGKTMGAVDRPRPTFLPRVLRPTMMKAQGGNYW